MENHIYGGQNFPFVCPMNMPVMKIAARIILVMIVLIPVSIVGGLITLVCWLI